MQKTHRDLLSEVQLLFAEKRTYFALLRTGLAVFTLPMTIIIFLGATNSYHKVFANALVATSVITALGFVALIGLVMFFQAEHKIKYLNAIIGSIKKRDSRIRTIIV
ncbi:MAG: hypothetical protein Q8P45_02605 [Candidatus Harrisonbacteria bacterium]|nr:hypothetical protein [Candidatus Harrisonbacteria bacterium]